MVRNIESVVDGGASTYRVRPRKNFLDHVSKLSAAADGYRFDGGASTAPKHLKAFPIDILTIFAAADGYQFDGGASAASEHVKAFPGDILTIFAAADGYRLAIRGNIESMAPYWQQIPSPYVSVISKVNVPSATSTILDTVPPSVLKLTVDWPAIRVPVRSRSVRSMYAGRSSLLTSITTSLSLVSLPVKYKDP
jgi:hypothetical protein